MESLHDLLSANATLRLFAVVGFGYLLGHLRIGGASLGVAAVLFVGLALGVWDAAAFELPQVLSVVGLTLFVYTMGLSSGPAVFRSLRSREGLRLSLLTVIAVLMAALSCALISQWLGLPGAQAAGLFSGGLTNTPALAAQLEYQGKLAQHQEVDRDGPAVGYSVAYPFGVLGTFAVMALLASWPGIDRSREVAAYRKRSGVSRGGVLSKNYRVGRLKPNGNQLEAAWLREHTGLVISRRLHSGRLDLVDEDSVLALGDIVLAVGTAEMHEKADEFLGELAPQHLEEDPQVSYRRFFVSSQKVVGRPLEDAFLPDVPATVTRVRRGDVEMPASPGLILCKGDVVRVVSHPRHLPRLAQLFGDSLEDIADTDFLSVSLGMVLGVLVGLLPIPLGLQPYPSLGVAGGTMVAALILGHFGRTGPIVWTISREANFALRQFGLLLFLACVGIKAGGQFQSALAEHGVRLLLAGAFITLASSVTLALALRAILKENLVTALGVMAGVHTQPACIGWGESLLRQSEHEHHCEGISVAYAAVFPVAMIAKIVVGTMLLSWLQA
jgi:putative transport protein